MYIILKSVYINIIIYVMRGGGLRSFIRMSFLSLYLTYTHLKHTKY